MTGGASRPEGLIIGGRILRVGALPPAAGPARTQWCVDQGLSALTDSRKQHGTALRTVMLHLPNGPADLPSPYPLHELHPKSRALVIGRSRVASWFALRRRLPGGGWESAEQPGRAGLQAAADAFNWLDDARQDLGEEALVDVASFIGRAAKPQSVGSLIETAHATVHASGELVGGLFGCRITYEEGRWTDRCIVDLLHLRFGNSPGMAVRHLCSVCGLDAGDCGHEMGEPYTVRAARIGDGQCTVCRENDCAVHQPGTDYQVIARETLADPRLREVSLTPRPRDPLARIASRSVEDERLQAQLGRLPHPDEMVLDHACMYPCTGFVHLPDS